MRVSAPIALLFAAIAADCSPIDDRRLLSCIAQVESADNPVAYNRGAKGRYQMRHRAIADATRRLISERYDGPLTQEVLAAAYLRTLRSYLTAQGNRQPRVTDLALAWNLGATGAARRGFRANDYAKRVDNLYNR